MAKKQAKRIRRAFSPEQRLRWQQSLNETENEREQILKQGQAALAARKAAREILCQLKSERERRGLSLADMMQLTGMSRESISRLENDPRPNPTMLTFARYAMALGLELRFTARKT
jgi:DNA-binding XRE family transcriptional regulator